MSHVLNQRRDINIGDIPGVKNIHLVTAGEGPLIILLHGVGSASTSFRHQVSELSDAFQVAAWDAPGYAGSTLARISLSLDGYADIVAGLIERLRPNQKAVLLGASWGGMIAPRVAARHPHLIQGLILADTTTGVGRAVGLKQRIVALKREGKTKFAADASQRLVGRAGSPELMAWVRDNMIASITIPGYVMAIESMVESDNTRILPKLTHPVLVLFGEHDTTCPPSDSRAIASMISNVELAPIPDAGHLSYLEQPAMFNRMVREFTSRVTAVHAQDRDANAPERG